MTEPLVLLHGFLGAPAAWDAVVARLGEAALDAVRPVLPGHGLPGEGLVGRSIPATWEETVDAVVDDLPSAAAVLVGYSNGGRIALGILARHPHRVAGLVLISAHLGIAEPGARRVRADDDARLAALAEDEGMEALVAAHAARPVLASQASLEGAARATLATRRRAHDPRAIAGTLRASGLGAMPDLRVALMRAGARGVPVVAMGGELDPTYTAFAREAAELAGGRSEIAGGCGHDLLLEAPDRVAAAIAEVACITERASRAPDVQAGAHR